MFQAVHLTKIRVHPFLEPVFAPQRLNRIGRWQRLTSGHSGREQRHLELFAERASLRSWLRHGYRIQVPGLGIMKPLRAPDSPYDRFYAPFFQTNRRVTERRWERKHGPLPYYPIQILLDPTQAELVRDGEEKAAVQTMVGQPVQGVSSVPMLIVYPGGCISGQVRLFVETEAPLQAENVKALLDRWETEWPWRVRFKGDVNRELEGAGPTALIEALVQRFRDEIVESDGESDGESIAGPGDPQSHTLVNVQGSLHDPETGARYKQAQRWLTQLAGIPYDDAGDGTIWGEREDEGRPWSIAGPERTVMAVDDAARAHLKQRRKENHILESRRALRNRAISTIELALATRLMYPVYEEWLEGESRAWEIEPLQAFWERVMSFPAEPALSGRIYSTLLFELAYLPQRLGAADPNNRELWLALFAATMRGPKWAEMDLEASMTHVDALARSLLARKKERQLFKMDRVLAGLDAINNAKGLLAAK